MVTLDFSQEPCKLVPLMLLAYSWRTKGPGIGTEADLTFRSLTRGPGSRGWQGTQLLAASFPGVGVSGRAEE